MLEEAHCVQGGVVDVPVERNVVHAVAVVLPARVGGQGLTPVEDDAVSFPPKVDPRRSCARTEGNDLLVVDTGRMWTTSPARALRATSVMVL